MSERRPHAPKMKSALFIAAGLLLAFNVMAALLWYTEMSGKILHIFYNGLGSLQGQNSNGELLSRVHDRILTCLDTTGMKDYYQREGLLNTSLTAAVNYARRVRELIPESFLTQSPNHCWLKDVMLQLNVDGDWFEARGRYGDIEIGYKSKFIHHNWHMLLKPVDPSLNDQVSLNKSMVCLPQVFLAGFAKCGSSYLYTLLWQHPMIVRPRIKEPRWWIRENFHTQEIAQNGFFLTSYLWTYRPLVKEMQKSNNFNLLSVDGTPSKLHLWPQLKGEYSGMNYCLLPAVFPEILPRAKYLVVLRNPTDMLYSAFWFSCTITGHNLQEESVRLKGPNIFHDKVVMKVSNFRSCIKHFPLVKCVQDMTEEEYSSELPCGRARVDRGLYYVHVLKWLTVVPRSKFLFLTLEELSADLNGTMAKVWHFLDLPHVVLHPKKRVNKQTKIDYRDDPRLAMREDTREMLDDFFAPYNQMLADLLGDDKFLWRS